MTRSICLIRDWNKFITSLMFNINPVWAACGITYHLLVIFCHQSVMVVNVTFVTPLHMMHIYRWIIIQILTFYFYQMVLPFCFYHIGYIKNNAWVTMKNDFWVTSEAICQWFSRVTKSRVKIIGKSHHEWPKNRYSRWRMYYFISYMLFDVLNTQFC